MIDYVDDWYRRLKGRLYEQNKGKVKIDKWVRLVAAQFQDLEDAAQSLLTIVNIDDSVGAQLDNLGRIVGQPRAVNEDAGYRLYLKACIAANRSNGTAEDLYRVFRALFGALGYVIRNGGNKSFALTVLAPLTMAQRLAAISFLRDAKEAGARAILEFVTVGDDPGVPTDNIMRWDVVGHGFDQAVWGGATQV